MYIGNYGINDWYNKASLGSGGSGSADDRNMERPKAGGGRKDFSAKIEQAAAVSREGREEALTEEERIAREAEEWEERIKKLDEELDRIKEENKRERERLQEERIRKRRIQKKLMEKLAYKKYLARQDEIRQMNEKIALERMVGEDVYIEKAPLSKSLSVAEIMAICSES